METARKNKAIKPDDVENKAAPPDDIYSFPEHGITVRANSQAEALEILKDALASREK